MKFFIYIMFVFFTLPVLSCDCEVSNSAIEFYNAKYVFEGTITSKAYAQDFQNYTITFYISKHYKNGATPKALSFVLNSEEEYTDQSTSCDWSVNLNEKWLVYAHLGKDGILRFSGICSNSKRIDLNPISENEQNKLNHGNTFKIEDYIYYQENGFTNVNPIVDIDSIFREAKTSNYKNNFTIIKFYINRKGELQSISDSKQFHLEYDSIFKLPKQFIYKEAIPANDFEKEAFKLAKKINKWQIKYHKKSNIPVSYIKPVIFQYDKKNHTWSYEL